MNSRSRFHLYALGRLSENVPQMTIIGEFESGRALQQVTVPKKDLDNLTKEMISLRSFVESRFPKDYSVKRLKDLGSRLFDILIQGDVKRLLDNASGKQSGFLPMEICVEDHGVAGWPWEYLYDKDRQQFLCQEFFPICRGIFTLDTRKELPRKRGKLQILVVVGVEPSDPEATPEEQIRWIQDVLKAPLAEREIDLSVVKPKRPEELQRILQMFRESRIDILHFFGHAGFDVGREEGFVSLRAEGRESFHIYANDLARMVAQFGIQLVFLNACETARSGKTEQPARSSVAAALLSRGIPAVIGTQFSMPDVSAHYLASMIYSALMTGRPLIEAVRDGRLAMGFAKNSEFFDWGIPVLYAFDPDLELFKSAKVKTWAKKFSTALSSDNVLQALASESTPGMPSIFDSRTTIYPHEGKPKARVALVDIDAKVGGLPDLIEKGNKVQSYYQLRLAYPPIPSGSFASAEKATSIFLPRIEDYLAEFSKSLDSNYVCTLTGCQIDDGEYSDLLASTVNDKVSLISTFGLRGYAKEAGVSFEKAVLFECLGSLLTMDERWNLDYHEQTKGCVLDFCNELGDLVEGLRHMKFDHKRCRQKIQDKRQLSAIDSLLALNV